MRKERSQERKKGKRKRILEKRIGNRMREVINGQEGEVRKKGS